MKTSLSIGAALLAQSSQAIFFGYNRDNFRSAFCQLRPVNGHVQEAYFLSGQFGRTGEVYSDFRSSEHRDRDVGVMYDLDVVYAPKLDVETCDVSQVEVF